MPTYLHFNIASEIIALLVGTFFLKRLDRKLLYLYVFVCIGLLTESSEYFLYELGLRNNMWLSHVYFPLEFLFLSLLYRSYFKHFFKKNWTSWVIALVMIYCLINPFFVQEFNEYSQVRSISGIILILFSILYFYMVLVEAKIEKLIKEPMVWVNTAVLLYFSTSLFYNLLFRFILEYSREFSKLTTYYFSILCIVFYLLIAISFWIAGTQKARA